MPSAEPNTGLDPMTLGSQPEPKSRVGWSGRAWVARSVERPTLAQVMSLQVVNSSPVSGFVLTAQSLEPVSDSVSLSVSAPSSLALSKIKIFFKN